MFINMLSDINALQILYIKTIGFRFLIPCVLLRADVIRKLTLHFYHKLQDHFTAILMPLL